MWVQIHQLSCVNCLKITVGPWHWIGIWPWIQVGGGINVKYHHFCSYAANSTISILLVESAMHPLDMITRWLNKDTFISHRIYIMGRYILLEELKIRGNQSRNQPRGNWCNVLKKMIYIFIYQPKISYYRQDQRRSFILWHYDRFQVTYKSYITLEEVRFWYPAKSSYVRRRKIRNISSIAYK